MREDRVESQVVRRLKLIPEFEKDKVVKWFR